MYTHGIYIVIPGYIDSRVDTYTFIGTNKNETSTQIDNHTCKKTPPKQESLTVSGGQKQVSTEIGNP